MFSFVLISRGYATMLHMSPAEVLYLGYSLPSKQNEEGAPWLYGVNCAAFVTQLAVWQRAEKQSECSLCH